MARSQRFGVEGSRHLFAISSATIAALVALTGAQSAAAGTPPAVAASPAAADAGGLELVAISETARYRTGQTVPLAMTVTNRGAADCRLAATTEGTIRIDAAYRDGKRLQPIIGAAYYLDGLETDLRDALAPAAPGGQVVLRYVGLAQVSGSEQAWLRTAEPLPGGGGLASLWPIGSPGSYRLVMTYHVPQFEVSGVPLCTGSSNSATVAFDVGPSGDGSKDGGAPRPVLLALAAAAALAVLALFWWTRRSRVRTTTNAAALMALGILLSVVFAPQRPAYAVITAKAQETEGFEKAVADCMALFAASKSDPAHRFIEVLKASKIPVTIVPTTGGSSSTATAKSPGGKGSSTIAWNPGSRADLEPGVPRDPCASLYHELAHSAAIAKGNEPPGDCADTDIPTEEVRATLAENAWRRSQRLKERTLYKKNKLPRSLDECRKKPSKAPKGPKRLCEGLPDQNCGATDGDPHLTTFDQRRYDVQAVGEFVLATSATGDFTVQARQAPLGDDRSVSVNSAVAFRVGKDRIGFYLGPAGMTVRLNGEAAAIRADRVTLPGGGVLVTQPSGIAYAGASYLLTWPDGSAAQLDPIGSYGIRLFVVPSPLRKTTLTGLLGNFDGNPDNDVATKAGKALAAPISFEQLYRELADSWRVGQDESLFDYAVGQNTQTYTDLTFPDRLRTVADLDPAAVEEARELCARAGVVEPTLMDNCLLDVVISGQAVFAVGAGASQPLAADAAPIPADQSGATTEQLAGAGRLSARGSGGSSRLTFVGTAGRRVFVDVPSSTLGDECVLIRLQDPDGDLIAQDCIVKGVGYIDAVLLTQTGTHTVTIDPESADPGSADVRVVFTIDQEIPVTVGAASVAVRLPQPGAAARITFPGAAGQRIFVNVAAATIPNECGALSLHDEAGAAIAIGCISNGSGYIDGTLLTSSGTYTVTFDPSGAATGSADFAVIASEDTAATVLVDGPGVLMSIARPGAVARLVFDGFAEETLTVVASDATIENECGLLALIGPEGNDLAAGCIIDGNGNVDQVKLPSNGRYTVVLDPEARSLGTVMVRVRR